MSIFVIGDLHLSFHENKPMSIFGDNWEGHEEKIKKRLDSKSKRRRLGNITRRFFMVYIFKRYI